METKWPSSPPSAADDRVLLTEDALDAPSAAALVEDGEHGAVVLFEGRVRATENGAAISSITYEAYEEMAEKELRAIAREAGERWGVHVALHHRLGPVPVNEKSLVIAVGGGHRAETFEACRWAVDAVKTRVPVWKTSFEKIP